jgi:hypothetical protein
MGMAVANMRDIVVGIEITASLGVLHPHTFPTYKVQRFIVEHRCIGT